jgi:SpoVK/Ycf46/Vps4 family AAA+-type ATPase
MMRKKNKKANTTLGFVEPQLKEKVTLYILRIILKCNLFKKFLDGERSYFTKDSLALFLGLEKYVDMDSIPVKEVRDILDEKLQLLEKQKKFSSFKTLQKNIDSLSKLMMLNKNEQKILEFMILLKNYDILREAVDLLESELNTNAVYSVLSIVLDIETKEIKEIFRSDSKFSKSSLITIDKRNTHSLDSKLDVVSNEFFELLLSSDEKLEAMMADIIKKVSPPSLKLKDFLHLKEDVEIIKSYLKKAMKQKREGVNILFYGLGGVGKTELSKTLAKELGCDLFEVSYEDGDGDPKDGMARLNAYKTAQSLFAKKKVLLMYDEAEDIFESRFSFFETKKQKNKAWINRTLESNPIPTIWITNDIGSIDSAIVRRFDIVLELPIPSKKIRKKIIKNYVQDMIDPSMIEVISENANIAPALVERAMKVAKTLSSKDTKVFTKVLNNTLKAQGFKEIEFKSSDVSQLYNPKLINTQTNLQELAKGIKKNPNARLCLYGPAGTGKSAYGKYIAEVLKKPLILKKGSDLLSMWVGGTEQNIANAFKEAQESNAVLVFDEVDSFLAERATANKNWEVTQVNEMLVQMENFDGVFIATTNLMENLDKASLRRFDLKLEFSYLKAQQAKQMFILYAKELGFKDVTKELQEKVATLRYLTPGDFAAVMRQQRFRPIESIDEFLARVEDEVKVKDVECGGVMGFLS